MGAFFWFNELAKQKANELLDEGLAKSNAYIEGLGLKKRRGRKKKTLEWYRGLECGTWPFQHQPPPSCADWPSWWDTGCVLVFDVFVCDLCVNEDVTRTYLEIKKFPDAEGGVSQRASNCEICHTPIRPF